MAQILDGPDPDSNGTKAAASRRVVPGVDTAGRPVWRGSKAASDPALPGNTAGRAEANRRMWQARDLRKKAATSQDGLLVAGYREMAADLEKSVETPQQRAAKIAYYRQMADLVDRVTAAGYLAMIAELEKEGA